MLMASISVIVILSPSFTTCLPLVTFIQVIVGRGIANTEHVRVAVNVTLTVNLSTGETVTLGGSDKIQKFNNLTKFSNGRSLTMDMNL